MVRRGNLGWAATPHCLLVEVDADRIVVTPYGPTEPGGEPRPIRVLDRAAQEVDARIVLERAVER